MESIEDRLLNEIIRYKLENDGIAPSYLELASVVNLSKGSMVYKHLNALEQKGKIKRIKGQARAIKVVGGYWNHRRGEKC